MIRLRSALAGAVLLAASAPAWAQGTGNGLYAEHWNNTTHTGTPVTTAVDQGPIDTDYGSGGPGSPVNNDNFSTRWSGLLEWPGAGTDPYPVTFQTDSDDSARLWINGVRIVNAGGTQTPAAISLIPGQLYPIMLEHTEGGGSARIRLRWAHGGAGQVAIPKTSMYSTTAIPAAPTATPDGGQTPLTVTLSTGTAGAEIYYTIDGSDPGLTGPLANPASRLYTGPIVIDTYTKIRARAYHTGSGSGMLVSNQFTPFFPALTSTPTTQAGLYRRLYHHGGGLGNAMPDWEAQIPQQRRLETAQLNGTNAIGTRDGRYDNFAMQFNGYINIPADGLWQFRTVSDDDSQVLIDGAQVLHNFGGTTDGFIWLQAGLHPIVVNHYDNTGGENVTLSWMSAPTVSSLAVVPAAALVTDLIAPTPTSSFNSGTNTVQIDVTGGATIYYTTDGSPPDPRSATGTGATGLTFQIQRSTRVRALAVLPGQHPSPIHEVTYVRTDLAGPGLVAVRTPGVDNRVEVIFAEPAVNPSASTATNYTLNNGATVTAAALQPRNADLRGWWKLDESVTGTSVADASPNGNTGTPSPGPSPDVPTPDITNRAPLNASNPASLNFDGTNDHVNIPDANSLDFGTDSFTVSAWIRPFDTTNRRLITKWDGPNDRGWIIELHNTGTGSLRFRVDDGGNSTDLILPAGITAGEWQHVAARFDRRSNRISIFRNGALIGSANTNTGFGNCDTARPLLLGRLENPNGTSSGNHYRGQMDDVRIYGVALSDAEISGLSMGADDPSTRVILTTSTLQAAPTVYALTVAGVLNPYGAPQSGNVSFSHQTGTVTNDVFSNITGGSVFDLTRNAAFPNFPTTSGTLVPAEIQTTGDNYGRLLRGYFIPPTTGNWVFSIASDDNGALWLSSDDDPARIRRISYVTASAAYRNHADADVVQSGPNSATDTNNLGLTIPLTAGQRYYFEAYQKEGGGGDNVAIAAKIDDGTPIAANDPSLPAAQIAPYVSTPSVLNTLQNRLVMAGQTVTFSANAVGIVEWRKGANVLGTGPTLTLNEVTPADDGTYSIRMNGTTTDVDVYSLTVYTPPAPTITAVTPTSGPSHGAQRLLVTGTNLMWGLASVSLGGSVAINPVYSVDGTYFYAQTTQRIPGLVDAVVTTFHPATTATLAGAYTYYDIPTIGSISPVAGDTDGTTLVTITGTSFVAGSTTVTFGSAAPVAATVASLTSLTVTAPAHAAGQVDVVVTTPFGSVTATNAFTYYDDPTLTLVSPAHGPDQGGPPAGFAAVTLTGTNFAPNLTTVTFGAAAPVAATVTNSTTLTVSPPAGTGAVDVTVTTPGGSATVVAGYTYHADPTITGVSPANGPDQGGAAPGFSNVSITGTNFVPGETQVLFGANPATAVTVDPSGNSLTCLPPAGTGTVSVTVNTPGGSATDAALVYTYHADPTASGITPDAHGPTAGGDTVTITGTNFVQNFTTVTVGGTSVPVTFNSTTSITVTTPVGAGPGTVIVEVTTPGGVVAVGGGYTYHDPPTISSVVANSGTTQGGNNVTVSGTNLPNNLTAITFGGTAGTNVNASGSSATVDVPTHAPGAVDVVVSTPGGTATLAGGYTYSGPFITSISPNIGHINGNQTVTITGAGFVPGQTTVSLGGPPITPTSVTGTQITFVTPSVGAPTVVDVTVNVASPAGSFTVTGGYEYVGSPTITSLSIVHGPTGGGQTVVIDGTNFAGQGQTVVSFGGTQATITGSSGSTQLTVTTPAHAAGNGDVVVTTFNAFASAASTYTYYAPPAVSTILPNRGPVAGGQSVVISGANFVSGATEVLVDGTPVTPGTVTATSLTFTTPAHAAGPATVIVRTFGMTNSQITVTNGYTYVDPATSVDLSLTMTINGGASAPATVGDTVTFILTVSNAAGAQNAAGVQVFNVLPAGLSLLTSTPSVGTYASGTWNVGALNANAGATLTLTARVDVSNTLVAYAEVDTATPEDLDSIPGNASVGEDDDATATVEAGLQILTAAALPAGTVRAFYRTTVDASGGTPPYTWSFISSTSGFPFNLAPSGVISGFAPDAVASYDVTLRVADASTITQFAQRTFTISIGAQGGAVVVAGAAPDGTVGTAYDHTYTATGGMPPYSWSVSAGTLPVGLVLDAATGRLAGTPTAVLNNGTFTVRATGTDAAFGVRVEPDFDVVANPVVFVTGGTLPDAAASLFYETYLEVSGGIGPAFTWSVTTGSTGGLNLTGNGRRAVLSGVAPPSGPLSFTIQVADGGQTAVNGTRAFTIDVLPAAGNFFVGTPGDSLPVATQGRPFDAALFAVTDGQPVLWTVVGGALPPGLTLNAGSGRITGTPTSNGTFAFDVRMQEFAPGTQTATATITITVAPPPTFTSSLTLPSGATGSAYFTQLTFAGGAPPVAWSATGLPAGLTLDPTSGTLSGTPSASGVFAIDITATDANGATVTATFTMTIADGTALAVSNSLSAGTVGTPYSATLQAVGGTGPYTWSVVAGTLPAGLALDPAAGTVSGTPTTAGSTAVTIQVTDSAGPPAATASTGSFTFVIHGNLAITTTGLPNAAQSTSYGVSLAASGGTGSLVWSVVSGTLPAGLSMSSTGRISGTAAATATTSTFQVRVTDGAGRSTQRAFTITVGPVGSVGGGGGGSGSGGGCGGSVGGLGGGAWAGLAGLLLLMTSRRRR